MKFLYCEVTGQRHNWNPHQFDGEIRCLNCIQEKVAAEAREGKDNALAKDLISKRKHARRVLKAFARELRMGANKEAPKRLENEEPELAS